MYPLFCRGLSPLRSLPAHVLLLRRSARLDVDSSLFDEGNRGGPKVPSGCQELVLKASGRWPHTDGVGALRQRMGQVWRMWAAVICLAFVMPEDRTYLHTNPPLLPLICHDVHRLESTVQRLVAGS